MAEGKVSSKYQVTLPPEVRQALGIKAGDKVRFEIEGGSLKVSVVRPDMDQALDSVLSEFDFNSLRQDTHDDAVTALRAQRGLDD